MTGGALTAGVPTDGKRTGGVLAAGVLTDGTSTAGVRTDGTLTDAVLTADVLTDGAGTVVLTDGTVTDGMVAAPIPTCRAPVGAWAAARVGPGPPAANSVTASAPSVIRARITPVARRRLCRRPKATSSAYAPRRGQQPPLPSCAGSEWCWGQRRSGQPIGEATGMVFSQSGPQG